MFHSNSFEHSTDPSCLPRLQQTTHMSAVRCNGRAKGGGGSFASDVIRFLFQKRIRPEFASFSRWRPSGDLNPAPAASWLFAVRLLACFCCAHPTFWDLIFVFLAIEAKGTLAMDIGGACRSSFNLFSCAEKPPATAFLRRPPGHPRFCTGPRAPL